MNLHQQLAKIQVNIFMHFLIQSLLELGFQLQTKLQNIHLLNQINSISHDKIWIFYE